MPVVSSTTPGPSLLLSHAGLYLGLSFAWLLFRVGIFGSYDSSKRTGAKGIHVRLRPLPESFVVLPQHLERRGALPIDRPAQQRISIPAHLRERKIAVGNDFEAYNAARAKRPFSEGVQLFLRDGEFTCCPSQLVPGRSKVEHSARDMGSDVT